MKRVRAFHQWRKARSNAAWERILRVRAIRRALAVVFGLGLSVYPIYAGWVLGVKRDFTPETWGELIGWGFIQALSLIAFGVALQSIERRPVSALIALVPVIGAPFVVGWAWVMSGKFIPLADRLAMKVHLLDGLDDIDIEVYRLRYDPDEEIFLSRRKTARRLNVSEERVRLAEGRLESRVERMTP